MRDEVKVGQLTDAHYTKCNDYVFYDLIQPRLNELGWVLTRC